MKISCIRWFKYRLKKFKRLKLRKKVWQIGILIFGMISVTLTLDKVRGCFYDQTLDPKDFHQTMDSVNERLDKYEGAIDELNYIRKASPESLKIKFPLGYALFYIHPEDPVVYSPKGKWAQYGIDINWDDAKIDTAESHDQIFVMQLPQVTHKLMNANKTPGPKIVMQGNKVFFRGIEGTIVTAMWETNIAHEVEVLSASPKKFICVYGLRYEIDESQ